jgi:hypothetical protein
MAEKRERVYVSTWHILGAHTWNLSIILALIILNNLKSVGFEEFDIFILKAVTFVVKIG